MEQPKVMIVLKNGQRWGLHKVKSIKWNEYSIIDYIEVYRNRKGFAPLHFFRNSETNILECENKVIKCILIKSIDDILDNIPLKIKYDHFHNIEFNHHYRYNDNIRNTITDRVMGTIINNISQEKNSINLSLDEYLSYPYVSD